MVATDNRQSNLQRHASAPTLSRQAWIDNVRTLMILLVVNMHACVTYSHVGSWYINEQPEPGMPVKLLFALWQGHLQSFFMGLLFFLAGIFAHRSLIRRGPGAFLKERFVRLGIPALLYMILIHPFIVFVMLGRRHISGSLLKSYFHYLTSARVLSGNGPLWFALALLVFCIVLVAWRVAVKSAETRKTSTPHPPGTAALLAFGAGLVVSTFLIRTIQPIGTNILNFQLCFFPQYIAAFAAGVLAGRQGRIEALAVSRRARIAGWLGLIGGPLLLVSIVSMLGSPPAHGPNPYAGGWNWQAFGLAFWEQTTGLAIGLGVLSLFQRRFDSCGAVATWFSSRAFAVYVLHAHVLVGLTFVLRPIPASAFVHAVLLTITGLVASFFVADLAKRVPGLRAIL